MTKGDAIRASIVIPTYRRDDLLERCLDHASRQTFSGSDYEIIVADDAADAGTRIVVERVALEALTRGGPHIGYVPVTFSRGPAGARNAGGRQARGDVLAFTDDDTLPDREWLANGVAAIEIGADAATGQTIVPLSGARPTDYERDVAGLATAEFVTANCFVQASVFHDVGGFDERFTRAWREDSDFHFRLLDRGCEISHVPEAIVVHPVRPAPWGVSLRQQAKSQDNALLYRLHPKRYRERIQPRPPLGYYASVLSFAGFLVTIGRHRVLATTLVAVWTGLTSRFAARRLRETATEPTHVAEMVVTSAMIPPISVFWRLRGAWKHRVVFF